MPIILFTDMALQDLPPESQSDEDLKLYAINALNRSDSERVVPLLENLINEFI